jgi:hypothetical protein
MPPAAVRNLRDLLYWQYAKIIAASAGMGKRQWAFIMDRFKKLRSGEIAWDSIREYVKEREDLDHCVYCGREGDLTLDHLFPRAFRGPQDEKNAAWVCPSCNASKGSRRLYEYWTSKGGLKAAKYDVPRLAEGKYLKLLHDMLEKAGVLDVDEDGLHARFCSLCDMNSLCQRERSAGKLSPLCLDGVATAVLRTTA